MPVSDSEYTAWLHNIKATRCILVEVIARVSGIETTRYLSNMGYFDTSAGREYDPIVVGNSLQIVERISIDGQSTINYGDIELINKGGDLDSWLEDIWRNRAVAAYIGDVKWARSDFRPIFVGVVDDIDSRDSESLNIKVRDKLARLNTPVSENTLGGSTPNKNELIPICFGEPHNITPLLADPATLDYRFHDGQAERVIEVRSNGVPAGVTTTLSSGKFVPDVNPQGTTITCDPQGYDDGGYITSCRDIIEVLVTEYGEANTRFTAGDLDSTNLNAFDSAHTQKYGIYLNRRENVKSICDEIASSIGAQMVMSRAGLLQLHQIDLPPSGTPTEITTADMFEDTLAIAERIPVQAAVTINYARNYTVQDSLDTGIIQKHKDSFAKEWWSVTSEDATTKTNYRLDAEPEPINTFLISESEASAEATRRLTLFKTQRHIISFQGRPNLIELQLGDPVTVTHPRFGLSGGKTGMVVGMSINWQNLFVELEVFL